MKEITMYFSLLAKDLKVGDTIKSHYSGIYETVAYVPNHCEWVVLKKENGDEYVKSFTNFNSDRYVHYKPPEEIKVWVNYKKGPKGIIPLYYPSKEKAIENAKRSDTAYKYLKTHYTIWHDDDLYSGAWLNLLEK